MASYTGESPMNGRILFFVAVALMWAAAVIIYIRHPEDWTDALLWGSIAGTFTVIGFVKKPPKA